MFLCDESPYKISDEKEYLIIWKNSNQKPKTISQKNHLIKAQAFFLSPKSVKIVLIIIILGKDWVSTERYV